MFAIFRIVQIIFRCHYFESILNQRNLLLNSIIIIEKPRISRQPPQCQKCQIYAHTRNWCRHPPRCVKCSENHHTDDRNQPWEILAKCVLCSGANNTNYKGCPAFKSRLQRQSKWSSSPDGPRPVWIFSYQNKKLHWSNEKPKLFIPIHFQYSI